MSDCELPGGSAADRIQALGGASDQLGPAVQSVLEVTASAIDSILACERNVCKAALSLAQRELLTGMIGELEAVYEAVVSLRGKPQDEATVSPVSESESWWFALSEATQALELSIDRLAALVGVQPRGATARDMVGIVLRTLREHHRLLIGEASSWIEG